MLAEIQCDKFFSDGKKRPPIKFHKGLNAILGDENRSNSIGKSTLLMILDFVFGGTDYIKKCEDVQNNVLEHTINFKFVFDEQEYYFSRNTVNYMIVNRCNAQYKPWGDDSKMTLDEYNDFLAEKYEVDKEGLSWRGAVAKYIRVYKRETMDEERPLQSAKEENLKDAIKKYMQQFEKYGIVEEQIKQAALAEDERNTFKKSQSYGQIRAAKTKKEYEENENRTKELEIQEKQLAENSNQGLLDLDSIQAQRLSELNDSLINYRRQRARVQTQLNSIRREMYEGKKSFKRTFADLEKFFPGEEFKELESVERFHQSLSKVLTEEFKETEKDLATAYVMLGNQIVSIKEQIAEVKNVPNVNQAILKEYARITTELNNLTEANKNFEKLEQLKAVAKEYGDTRDRVIATQLSEIQTTINQRMKVITKRILKNEIQRAPELKLEKLNRYSFSTKDDGGSGAQFRGLITFDLANMEISGIPFIVHDSDLLDPIEKPALTEIIKEYEASKNRNQQIFASFRSLDFYAEDARPLISKNAVIELSSGGNELFGRAWNKEPLKEEK
ncbi:TPA: DUF2326 domain-containing protein [Streptococcus equi subsp. zooepidemicus]|nr:DUF2326 domain-containing protein [Streptococcus equi subsp. zooepidemicus]HEL1229764.1 DUF2326 domain-containing protein [Streptococcus equi subsp. zooepidemicus]